MNAAAYELLIIAAQNGDLNYLKEHVTRENVSIIDKTGGVLFQAVHNLHFNCVEYLLSIGIYVKHETITWYFSPPQNGPIDMFRLLINAVYSSELKYVIINMMIMNRFDCIMELIDKGIRPQISAAIPKSVIAQTTIDRVNYMINNRINCHAVITTYIGLTKRGIRCFGPNNRDVCTLIMKHLWSMRFECCDA
jgi:hypothetical protein